MDATKPVGHAALFLTLTLSGFASSNQHPPVAEDYVAVIETSIGETQVGRLVSFGFRNKGECEKRLAELMAVGAKDEEIKKIGFCIPLEQLQMYLQTRHQGT